MPPKTVLLLVGCGKLLLPAPGASAALPWALIAGGLASVALWWRGAFGRERYEGALIDVADRPGSA